MSKKLNIIEAMKMPIGTEFEVEYKDTIDCSKISIKGVSGGTKIFIWNDGERLALSDRTLKAIFIPIQQPVSFMEAVASGKKVRAECEGYFDIDKKYYRVVEVLKDIIMANKQYGNEIVDKAIKSYITKGKWYIEESEADSNDIR